MTRTVLQLAVAVGAIVAVGLLVAAHPVTGLVLIVSVAVLALLFGRAPIATRAETPQYPIDEGDEPPRP